MNRRNLWLTLAGVVLACVLIVVAGRRHSFDLELVDEYTGEGGVEEPADQPLD